MKRILVLVLTVVLLITICGCKKTSSKKDVSNTESDEVIVVTTVTSTVTSSNKENSSKDDKDTSSNSTGENASQDKNPNEDSKTEEKTDDKSQENDNVSQNKIEIDYDTEVELYLYDDIIKGYLEATDPTTQYTFLSEYDKMVLDHQNLYLSWKPDGSMSYTLYISEKSDFSNAYTTKIEGKIEDGMMYSSKVNTICYPGKTYYWKVLGQYNNEPLGGGKIKINDSPVRWITIDGVKNVRDMGGWKTESGKTVNYGKIYRGSSFKDITDKGIQTIKTLGIKTDIDIRSTASWDSHGAVPSTGLKYHFFDTNAHYDYVFGNDGKPVAEVKENYPKMFELLADESNYPIYLHCNYGNDRTGSMAFILNGLLGVNYEDLTRDYELTSYAFSHDRRWRGEGKGGTFAPDDLIQPNISNSNVDGRWGMMNKAFMESKYCTDGKLSTSIENFLLDAGVKKEHIEAYKKIMLS